MGYHDILIMRRGSSISARVIIGRIRVVPEPVSDEILDDLSDFIQDENGDNILDELNS